MRNVGEPSFCRDAQTLSICATDEDSPSDPADENREAEGKEKKLEEAGEGVYPLRVFMGRLVRGLTLRDRRGVDVSLVSGSIWQSSTIDTKVHRQGTEVLRQHVDGERNELVDGWSNAGTLHQWLSICTR